MTKILSSRFALVGLGIFSSAGPALAHSGHDEVHGFLHGFMHPIGGADHMLAMIAVGILAAVLGGRALWMVPISFMSMMAIGAGLAMAGVYLPFVELGITLSVVALGAAIALRLPLTILAAACVAGFFALFHGYAHGSEMPLDAAGADYAMGFLAATGILHLVGIGIGAISGRLVSMTGMASRVAGGAIAIAGLCLAV